MNKRKALILASLVLAGTLGAGVARAGDVYWSVGVHAPNVSVGVSNAPRVVVHPAPVYYPAPVYVRPRRVVVVPQPVYVRPAPVIVAPAPVYHVPPRHGKRHWRHWDRRDWDGRHGDRHRWDRHDRRRDGHRAGWGR